MQDCHSCDPGSIPGVGATLFRFHRSVFIGRFSSRCGGHQVPHQRQHQQRIKVLPELNLERRFKRNERRCVLASGLGHRRNDGGPVFRLDQAKVVT